jgi:hypothetical protein
MTAEADDRALDGGALPFSPVTLVLARDPRAVADLRETAWALDALAEAGKKEEAHRLADPLIGEAEQRGALAGFYLREVAGRRGARLLLRWLRADEALDEAEQVFVARAIPAVQAWAQFRLLRHGRAMSIAKEAIEKLESASGDEADAALRDEARAWGQALEAIRRTALRRGNLRLALNFHGLAEELGRGHPWCLPEKQRAKAAMTAVAFLLELHTEHGLPATVARYLARSLGHDEGDSRAAYAELVGDLSLRPEHLDGALEVADRFGFAERVSERIEAARERLFQGRWQVRRAVQRGVLLLLFVLLAVLALLGFTLLVHFVSR